MSNQWLRLWHDMPNDPKWRTIARISGQPIALVQAVYLHLLVDASRNVTRGHVTVTAEDLASALDVTDEDIEAVLAAMQGRVLDGLELSGWDKRQPKREDQGSDESGAKSATERKREQRQREREARDADMSRQCHDESRDVTTDKDTEKDKDTEENHSSSSNVSTHSREPARSSGLLPLPEPSSTVERIGVVCRTLRSRGVQCSPSQFAAGGKYAGLEQHSDDDFHLAVQTLQERGETRIGIGLLAAVLGDITEQRKRPSAEYRPRPAKPASVTDHNRAAAVRAKAMLFGDTNQEGMTQ
ncbi:hypothetical protein [Chromobacterium subtsugae]|uniref:hypothetical protein n=1 Tax=Chromobacterium subtsugae TaxID=251747 RepID=UPI00069BF590|nr:hypothetical protein [Chromobacterium subtsugae]